MKIGIITFWESNNNYGQILQLFALQSALRKIGHSPFLIRYHRVAPNDSRSLKEKIININLLSFIKYRLQSSQRQKASIADQKRDFKTFKEEFIVVGKENYYHIDDLKKSPPVADAYITGSDQVWNHTFFVSPEAFLLGFGNDGTKKISYAASYGVDYQDNATKEMFKDNLASFSGISVREKNGVELTKELGYVAEWVLDPTMLFTKEEWFELLNLEIKELAFDIGLKRDQIFIYTLGNSKITDKQKFLNYAKGVKDMKVIHATANNDFSGKFYPTIQEWVHYISTSKLVITTSFHGMLFCIINNTNFVVLPNTGRAKGMNYRIESMLKAIGLLDHIMDSFDEEKMNAILRKEINWQSVNDQISAWRIKSYDFLNRHLDEQ